MRNANHYGVSGKGGAAVTTIKSNDPMQTAQELFDKIGYGGAFMTDVKAGQITKKRVRLRDGAIVNYRVVSKCSGPAVEINVKKSSESCGLRSHKMHFI